MGVLTTIPWPGDTYRSNSGNMPINLEWLSLDTVNIGQLGTIDVFNASGQMRLVELQENITLDLSQVGVNGRDRTARVENGGYDVYCMVRSDIGEAALLAAEYGVDPIIPAGYDWVSLPFSYLCVNVDQAGTLDGILPFTQERHRIMYSGCADNLQVVSGETATGRTALPFTTISTTNKGQIPNNATLVFCQPTVSNVDVTVAVAGLYWTAACADPFFTTTQSNFGVGAIGNAFSARPYLPVSIRATETTDTSLYVEWAGAPGNPNVDVLVFGFER